MPGYERAGAGCVSAFLVDNEADAVAILADTVREHYGLTSAGDLRAAQYDLIGTDIEDEGELIPHSDRHIDVVVCRYPDVFAPYDQLARADRRTLRQELADVYGDAPPVLRPSPQIQ